MGRKLHRKVVTKPRPSLPRIFECPRCEAQAVKIDIKETPTSIATITCGNCHISKTFTGLKSVYEKIDVYGWWVDSFYEDLEKGIISEEFETDEEEEAKSESNDETIESDNNSETESEVDNAET